ncbi:hypothetical protein EKO27_g12085 [Xylaria grammica]|uniref:Uncharacterized protein n=1 Tax=Xylaria grammica TaxID=363999 RepID=A0A439CLR1_9PEZI|nr:hypothetical protein EKO27_g12085 [Xylaria grammica]
MGGFSGRAEATEPNQPSNPRRSAGGAVNNISTTAKNAKQKAKRLETTQPMDLVTLGRLIQAAQMEFLPVSITKPDTEAAVAFDRLIFLSVNATTNLIPLCPAPFPTSTAESEPVIRQRQKNTSSSSSRNNMAATGPVNPPALPAARVPRLPPSAVWHGPRISCERKTTASLRSTVSQPGAGPVGP